MNCVVTGGAGFIGSHVVDALVARGEHVTVIDNLSTGRRSNLDRAIGDGAELHVADVTNAEARVEVFAAVKPELVFHLAAQIDVRHSVADPADRRHDQRARDDLACSRPRGRPERAGS